MRSYRRRGGGGEGFNGWTSNFCMNEKRERKRKTLHTRAEGMNECVNVKQKIFFFASNHHRLEGSRRNSWFKCEYYMYRITRRWNQLERQVYKTRKNSARYSVYLCNVHVYMDACVVLKTLHLFSCGVLAIFLPSHQGI